MCERSRVQTHLLNAGTGCRGASSPARCASSSTSELSGVACSGNTACFAVGQYSGRRGSRHFGGSMEWRFVAHRPDYQPGVRERQSRRRVVCRRHQLRGGRPRGDGRRRPYQPHRAVAGDELGARCAPDPKPTQGNVLLGVCARSQQRARPWATTSRRRRPRQPWLSNSAASVNCDTEVSGSTRGPTLLPACVDPIFAPRRGTSMRLLSP